MSSDTPILLIIFNRPDKVKYLISALKKFKPKNIYVFADGPRLNNSADVTKCVEAREVIKNIDWECNIYTNFSEKNLGCKYGPITGITWFFTKVEQGIILEDDCIPDPSFFSFCAELLEKYKHDKNIMHISGNNFQNGKLRSDGSYYFSLYSHSWGWATWARAWQKFQIAVDDFPNFLESKKIETVPLSKSAQKFWLKNFIQTISGTDSWDSLWLYTIWYNQALCIIPNQNLVSNIGFDNEATHTFTPSSQTAVPTKSLSKVIHPTEIKQNREADDYTYQTIFYTSLPVRLYNKARVIIIKYL